MFVLDVDPRHGGDAALEDYEANRDDGPLPPTLTAATGGGGTHLFYRYPLVHEVPGRNPWLPGVDVKSNGGYVILPPSNHASGSTYTWRSKFEPAIAPLDLIVAIQNGKTNREANPLPPASDILKGVPEGRRDDVLFRHACQLRRKGYDLVHIRLVILEAARNSIPPFPEDQAERKVQQAWSYRSDADDLPIGVVDDDARHLTDDGNAHRFIDQHGDDLRYSASWGWVTWTGTHWQRDETLDHVDRARRTVQSIYLEATDEEDRERRKALNQWAFRSESAGRIEAMTKIARSDPLVTTRADQFDPDPWILNCLNGSLDLRTMALGPHRKDDMITRVTGFEFDPQANAPRWAKLLERIVPEPDVRTFIQRAAGYSLTGVTREKIMLILHGSGDNGKTVFLEALRSVMGTYAVSAASSMLVSKRGSGTGMTNDIARLAGARFVTSAETEEGAKMASSFIKEITGGDKIMARFLYAENFEFTPQFKLWLGTNHPPIITDFGDAMWRRLRMIPFHVIVPKAEQIPRDELLAALLEEGPGILRWAVEGCVDWQEHGLQEPSEVMLATETYRDEMDWFGDFIDEVCAPYDGATTILTLYDSFKQWCAMRGDMRPWSISAFTRQLKSRGYQPARTRTGAKGFMGIQLKAVANSQV